MKRLNARRLKKSLNFYSSDRIKHRTRYHIPCTKNMGLGINDDNDPAKKSTLEDKLK